MTLIGAHVSTSGGIHKCFENAHNIGAQCIQIFGASPRMWKAKLPEKETIKKYFEEKDRFKIDKVFLHASYLVNLGTPDKELYIKSVENLKIHLEIAELIKAEGLIYHIGSAKNSTPEESYKRICEGMNEVISKVPGKAQLIMENSAGGGDKIGTTIEEIGVIFKQANNNRIKVCIDTAHAFGAGIIESYSPVELNEFTKKCDQAFDLKNLVVLHINDSKVPFDSKKDRHENIGEGHIGREAFRNLLHNKDLSSIPWLLEVPGFNNNGPDKENIDILKSLKK